MDNPFRTLGRRAKKRYLRAKAPDCAQIHLLVRRIAVVCSAPERR